jgi:hypothetical protein
MGSSSRRWGLFTAVGLGVWIGVTVLVGATQDDPTDPGPTLIAFAAGGTAFFGCVFGAALWHLRPRRNPELDALLRELVVEPGSEHLTARGIEATRRIAFFYVLGGILVTALGLAAVWQQALDVGDPAKSLLAIAVLVGGWALATRTIVSRAFRASGQVLGPLGLALAGSVIAGKRHGREVRISIEPGGSKTRVEARSDGLSLSGAEEILAVAGRGESGTWEGVSVSDDGDHITVRREGHDGPSWLWDLWLAERLAGDRAQPRA